MFRQWALMNEFNMALVFSVLAHIVVATVSIVGLPALKRDFNPLPDIIPVEFVTLDDVTRSVDVPAPQQPTPQQPAPQTEQRSAAIPENVEIDAVPTFEQANADADIEPVVNETRRPRPNVAPQIKPRPPSALDTARLALQIDRARIERAREEQAAASSTPEDNTEKIEEAIERAQMSLIEARRATITIQAFVQSKVERCWSVPAGAKGAADLSVQIKIRLRLDGTIIGVPEIMDTSRMSDTFYRAAAESAVRAVRICAPYELPQDQYNLWRELIFTFDPKELLDG